MGHIIHKISVQKKKVLVFSPHPDDDVISMGGTIKKLKDQGHQVSVAYMVTGSNAVHDYEAQKYLYFVKDFLTYNINLWGLVKESETFRAHQEKLVNLLKEAETNIHQKRNQADLPDNEVVKNIKGLIRSS